MTLIPSGINAMLTIRSLPQWVTLLSAAGAAIPAEHPIDGIDLRSGLEVNPRPPEARALEADSLNNRPLFLVSAILRTAVGGYTCSHHPRWRL